MVTAGDLRERVDYETSAGGRPGLDGQHKPKWSKSKTNVPARVRAMNGRETFEAGQFSADVSHAVDVRYDDAYSPAGRFVHCGRVMHIVRIVDTDGKRRFMVALCTQHVTGARAGT